MPIGKTHAAPWTDGPWLRAARDRAGVSMAEQARRMSVSRQRVYMWERHGMATARVHEYLDALGR